MADENTNAEAVETPETAPEEKVEATSPEPTPEADQDWKARSRQHERAAKAERKRAEELASKLEEFESASKTEQEKAIDQARKEAAEEARKELLGEVRSERLQAQVAKAAAGRFADVDDAIRLLDADESEIFDEDGGVDPDALNRALGDLLEKKPHLGATPNGGKPVGDADAGKGEGGSKSLNDFSVEEHLSAVRRHQ